MPWTYHQSTGQLWNDTALVATGYSGAEPDGKNNPNLESLAGIGPIPRGSYTIGAPFNSHQTGPYAMRLTPNEGTDTYGRSDFEMHGDSKEHPGQASHGCIIMPFAIRARVWLSNDHVLEVV